MSTVRVTDKTTVTTLAGTEFAGVFIAAGDKKITYADLFTWIKAQLDIDPDNVVLLAAAQTLTNKTLTSPKLNENVAITALATDVNLLAGLAAAGLTATELGYINGLTSAIQTQLNLTIPRYGSISIAGGSTAQTIATGSLTKLTPFTVNGPASSLITVDAANDKITISEDGLYRIATQITFTSNVDAFTCDFSLFDTSAGAAITKSTQSVYVITGAQKNSISLECQAYISGETSIELHLNHNKGSNAAITVTNANLAVQRIVLI